MMYDAVTRNNTIGYVYLDRQSGQISAVGTECRIVQRQLLEDGRQFVALEGISRFRIKRIIQTLPYVVADVQRDVEDDPEESPERCRAVELEVYFALRYYMYLMRRATKGSRLTISAHARDTRPRFASGATEPRESARRTNFSFALANMMQMTVPREAQLLLQSPSITRRLQAQLQILSQAAAFVSTQLVQSGVITEVEKEVLRRKAYADFDDPDDEIFPAAYQEEDVKKPVDEWDINSME
jgi:Lon protease-like protein